MKKGLFQCGEKHPATRLKEEDIRRIRQLAKYGLLQKQIARRYKITQPCVSCIVNYKTWKHI